MIDQEPTKGTYTKEFMKLLNHLNWILTTLSAIIITIN